MTVELFEQVLCVWNWIKKRLDPHTETLIRQIYGDYRPTCEYTNPVRLHNEMKLFYVYNNITLRKLVVSKTVVVLPNSYEW